MTVRKRRSHNVEDIRGQHRCGVLDGVRLNLIVSSKWQLQECEQIPALEVLTAHFNLAQWSVWRLIVVEHDEHPPHSLS